MQTDPSVSHPFVTTELSRGGTLVERGPFRAQLGSYPETIKDTMKLDSGVPDLYILPDELFDTYRGVSNSDLEFPVYFNYFIKQKRCRVVCHRHQLRPIVRVLREAVIGPFKLYLDSEYPDGAASHGFPDMRSEMKFYKEDSKSPRGYWGLKDMVTFYLFDCKGKVDVDDHLIQSLGNNRYRISSGGSLLECEFKPTRVAELSSPEPSYIGGEFYEPPLFGVTVIGSGHGFDTEAKTSGFIIWVDGKGIMVDPPVNSTDWLRQNKINPRIVEDLILTHCHADHDSGTLQKILEEGRVKVHTTTTVLKSFQAKYASITQLAASEFVSLFEFVPLQIGIPITIAGATFHFKYTLHPIPTLGFEVHFQGKSFYYSCDTLYCPETIEELHQRGVLSTQRRDDLLDVAWNSTLIFHEAGIPPIHTPLKVLEALPDAVKQNMFLVHVSESAIPKGSGLRLATPGTEGTINIPISQPSQKSLAVKILDVVSHIDLFADMKFKKALDCLAITQYRDCEPGEFIIKRNSYGDKFYMILSGVVEVLHESLPHRLFFTRYDYLGETALILNKPRNADIVALTRTELLFMERQDFLRFIGETDLPALFKRLDQNRSGGARWTFEKDRVLAALSPLQKNQLMCSMIATTLPRGTRLFAAGDIVEWYYLVDAGHVLLEHPAGVASLGPGSLVGEFDGHFEAKRHGSQAVAATDLEVFKVGAGDMSQFFQAYPGTFVRMKKNLSDVVRRAQFGPKRRTHENV